jgi:hypothetical protein
LFCLFFWYSFPARQNLGAEPVLENKMAETSEMISRLKAQWFIDRRCRITAQRRLRNRSYGIDGLPLREGLVPSSKVPWSCYGMMFHSLPFGPPTLYIPETEKI